MPVAHAIDSLPLRWSTPGAWAEQVLEQPLALLNDHAHLEKKAAVNALDLLNRWPAPSPPEDWVQVMTTVARDEVEHLAVVARILARRGGQPAAPSRPTPAVRDRAALRRSPSRQREPEPQRSA